MTSSSIAQAVTGEPGQSSEMQNCIANCIDCHAICAATVNHCLMKGDVHGEIDDVRLLMDCAEICQTSANFMLRSSNLHVLTCGICSDICEQCARECDEMSDDPMMKQCAGICRRCAESCARMAHGTH